MARHGNAGEHEAETRSLRSRMPSGFATLRDLASFVAGIVIIAHEVFYGAEIRAYAVGVGIALTGLPLALGADERATGKMTSRQSAGSKPSPGSKDSDGGGGAPNAPA